MDSAHKTGIRPSFLNPAHANGSGFSHAFAGLACSAAALCVAPAFYLDIAIFLGFAVWLFLGSLVALVGALISTRGRPDVPIAIGVLATGIGALFLATAPCFSFC